MEKSTIFSKEELALLDHNTIPRHIAIIMDGNRRWAKTNKLKCLGGHRHGADNLTEIVKATAEIGIKILTVYAFSTENWSRPKVEIDSLMNLFESYLLKYGDTLKKEKVRLKTIGDLSLCPSSLQKILTKLKEETKNNDTIDLVIAINYGSRDEITRAVKNIVNDYDKKKVTKKDITENLISKYLDTACLSDPEVFIRTSGEYRISNFLLWQISYSEIFFVDELWPDFSEKHLLEVILEYQKRERRLGR